MSDDLIDSVIADLNNFYPGSKRKRRVVEEPKPKEDTMWDSHPHIKPLPNGKDIELFTAGALAQALNRPFITIRTWNQKGYLPSPPYRLPTKKNKNGEDHKGRRLYSRAMIEAAIALFAQFEVLHVNRIDWSTNRQLTVELAEAWTKIQAEETKPTN
jgi:hypothetical protein